MSTPSIEDVLRLHYDVNSDHALHGYECSCGWGAIEGPPPWRKWTADEFRAHVADAIRAHLAEHADEAAGAVERVRAVCDQWAERAPKHYTEWAHAEVRCEREIRAALAGGASEATKEADQ